jgi:hypothetical protein
MVSIRTIERCVRADVGRDDPYDAVILNQGYGDIGDRGGVDTAHFVKVVDIVVDIFNHDRLGTLCGEARCPFPQFIDSHHPLLR